MLLTAVPTTNACKLTNKPDRSRCLGNERQFAWRKGEDPHPQDNFQNKGFAKDPQPLTSLSNLHIKMCFTREDESALVLCFFAIGGFPFPKEQKSVKETQFTDKPDAICHNVFEK